MSNTADTLTFSGPISGNGGVITVSGSGTVILAGSNTYGGGTNISSAPWNSQAPRAWPQLFRARSPDSGTLELNFSGVTGPVSFGNSISGSGKLLVASPGTTVQISTTNSYTGGTNISAGTLQINSGTLGTGPLQVASGALLDLNGNSLTIGALSGAGVIDDVGSTGSATLTINQSTGTTFSGQINNTSGGTVSLAKLGTGTLTLTGASGFSGTITVGNSTGGGGVLVIGTGGVINCGVLTGTGANPSGFQVSGGSLTSTGASSFSDDATAFAETAGNVSLGAVSVPNGDGAFFNISGGNFTAASINIPRSQSYTTAPTAAAPIAAVTTSGIYIHGSTANFTVTGSLGVRDQQFLLLRPD